MQEEQTSQKLNRQLKSRHIIMMALGGAIGAGLFQGSTNSISQAGPGVVFAYLLGGIILLFVMQGLGELVVRNPGAQTFRDLITPILGPFAGHVAGWVYWLDWVLVMAAETAAAAQFLSYWFPQIPLWLLALVISVVMTALNLFQVRVYGETEYWIAGIKIAVLVLFVVLGGLLLFTELGGHPGTGFRHLTNHGGLFPLGLNGFASAMLVVMFSFGGTETIGMTIAETENPAQVIPRAARSVIVRILLFYVLPILVIVSLVPWDQLGTSTSPFVTVFQALGIPYAGGIMNFVMLTAVLSATNTGMYAASRMLYTQASAGQAPRWFAKLSSNHVPVRALLCSTAFLYLGVAIAIFAKGHTFGYLMTIPGYSVMIVWMLLAFAHVRSRRQRDDVAAVRGGNLVGSWFATVALAVIFIGVLLTSPVWGTIAMIVVMLLVILGYFAQADRKTAAEH